MAIWSQNDGNMKSTTARFGDEVYSRLEAASDATGLPINSIVVAACLAWLKEYQPQPSGPAALSVGPSSRSAAAAQDILRRSAAPLIGTRRDPLSTFTLAAQDALGEARDEAVRMDRSWIGTEHLLVGLCKVEEGRAAQVLRALQLDLGPLRARLELEGPASPQTRGEVRLPTTRVRAVIRLARQEARREKSERMGTGHLLIGLLLDAESQAAALLEEAGVTELAVRRELVGLPPEE